MKTPVPDLGATVRYHLEDGTVTDGDPPADRVTLAELQYPCPHCDHPNVAAHTPPLVEGMVDTCDHCDRSHRLTPAPETDRRPKALPATVLEDSAGYLEGKRRARILGERLPDTAITAARRGKRVRHFAVMGGLLGILPVFFTAGMVADSITSNSLPVFLAAVLSCLLWAAIAAGLYHLSQYITHASLNEYLDDDDITIVAKHVGMAEHGRRVSNDDDELYVPPREDADRDLDRELA